MAGNGTERQKREASRRPIEIPRTYKIADKNVLELESALAPPARPSSRARQHARTGLPPPVLLRRVLGQCVCVCVCAWPTIVCCYSAEQRASERASEGEGFRPTYRMSEKGLTGWRESTHVAWESWSQPLSRHFSAGYKLRSLCSGKEYTMMGSLLLLHHTFQHHLNHTFVKTKISDLFNFHRRNYY